MKNLIALLLGVLLCQAAAAQKLAIATEDEIKKDVDIVPCNDADRLDAVQKLFRSMGATDADISVVDKKKTKNVIVTKKGTGDGTIVIGAHYDKVHDGCGAIDNWTGIVVIAHLYGTLRQLQTQKTLEFVAFDREEEGLIGSDVFVSGIAKDERSSVCSMVNLDSFGFANTQVLENASSPKMTAAAKEFWRTEKLDLASASIANADADSSSFVKAGIPAITFHGLSNDWPKYLHSSNDKLSNINMRSVYQGYRLILPFIVELDSRPCDALRKK